MCIVFNALNYQSSDTLIVVAPVVTPVGCPQQWQMVYLNSMNKTSSQASPRQPFGTNETVGFVNPNTEPPPLMVFAVPNPHDLQEHEFPLFPVDQSCSRALRQSVDKLLKPYSHVSPAFSTPENLSFGSAQSSGGMSATPPLTLQIVGGYKVCVAPSLVELHMRAPWDRFSLLTADVAKILSDIGMRYGNSPMAFVIAEGFTTSFGNFSEQLYISNSGFGIGYCDARPHPVFFPTSHEPPSVEGAEVDMNVTLVAINSIIRPLSILPEQRYGGGIRPIHGNEHGDQNVLLCVDDTFGICSVQQTDNQGSGLFSFGSKPQFPFGGNHAGNVGSTQRTNLLSFGIKEQVRTKAETAEVKSKWTGALADLFKELPRRATKAEFPLTQLESPQLVTLWRLNTRMPNGDVTGRKATEMDVHVSRRLFNDIDAWLRLKVSPPPSGQDQNMPTSMFSRPRLQTSWLKQLDVGLALLARQLSDPGMCDRFSDVSRPGAVSKNAPQCGPVCYLNLDLDDIDLNEEAYVEKEAWARRVRNGSVDTTGTTYVRISAALGPLESLTQRTVQPIKPAKVETPLLTAS